MNGKLRLVFILALVMPNHNWSFRRKHIFAGPSIRRAQGFAKLPGLPMGTFAENRLPQRPMHNIAKRVNILEPLDQLKAQPELDGKLDELAREDESTSSAKLPGLPMGPFATTTTTTTTTNTLSQKVVSQRPMSNIAKEVNILEPLDQLKAQPELDRELDVLARAGDGIISSVNFSVPPLGRYYVIYDELPANEYFSLKSHVLVLLPQWSYIDVMQVFPRSADGRIRARINSPGPGLPDAYITIVGGSSKFAAPVVGLEPCGLKPVHPCKAFNCRCTICLSPFGFGPKSCWKGGYPRFDLCTAKCKEFCKEDYSSCE